MQLHFCHAEQLLYNTDNNGIIDGNEDFDEDGLSDYEDIVLQFDSNKAGTDDNGILDGDEFVEQKYLRQKYILETTLYAVLLPKQ